MLGDRHFAAILIFRPDTQGFGKIVITGTAHHYHTSFISNHHPVQERPSFFFYLCSYRELFAVFHFHKGYYRIGSLGQFIKINRLRDQCLFEGGRDRKLTRSEDILRITGGCCIYRKKDYHYDKWMANSSHTAIDCIFGAKSSGND